MVWGPRTQWRLQNVIKDKQIGPCIRQLKGKLRATFGIRVSIFFDYGYVVQWLRYLPTLLSMDVVPLGLPSTYNAPIENIRSQILLCSSAQNGNCQFSSHFFPATTIKSVTTKTANFFLILGSQSWTKGLVDLILVTFPCLCHGTLTPEFIRNVPKCNQDII